MHSLGCSECVDQVQVMQQVGVMYVLLFIDWQCAGGEGMLVYMHLAAGDLLVMLVAFSVVWQLDSLACNNIMAMSPCCTRGVGWCRVRWGGVVWGLHGAAWGLGDLGWGGRVQCGVGWGEVGAWLGQEGGVRQGGVGVGCKAPEAPPPHSGGRRCRRRCRGPAVTAGGCTCPGSAYY